MATDDGNRLDDLEAAIDSLATQPVASLAEFLRQQEVRQATVFGSALREFRTRVRLHFTGEAVDGHNLEGMVAGDVVQKFTSTVRSAGNQLGFGDDRCSLYLTPNVRPGSTILEFAGPRPLPEPGTSAMDPLDPAIIPDSEIDRALDYVLNAIEELSSTEPEGDEVDLDQRVGQRLFSLADSLIRGGVALGIDWQRPSGIQRSTVLTREVTIQMRAALDRPAEDVETRQEIGILKTISSDGHFRVLLPSGEVGLDMPTDRLEDLRELWNQHVLVVFTTTRTWHPNRKASQSSHQLLRIAPAGGEQLTIE